MFIILISVVTGLSTNLKAQPDCEAPTLVFSIVDNCDNQTFSVFAELVAFGTTNNQPNFSLVFDIDRSDAVVVDDVTVISPLLGETVPIIENVPFQVGVSGIVTGFTILGDFNSECVLTGSFEEIGLCPPPNDDCTEAITAICGMQYIGSTSNNSGLPAGLTGFPLCGTPLSTGGVWYNFTAPFNSIVSLNTNGSGYDTKLFVFTSNDCETFTCVGGNDDSGDGLNSLLNFNANSGGEFKIFVSGFGSSSGNFVLNIGCTEVFCTAPTVTASVQTLDGTPIIGCVPPGQQVNILVSVAAGVGNTSFNVTTGVISQVVLNNGSALFGPFNLGLTSTFNVVGIQDPLCTGSVQASTTICAPVNDLCANALPLACGVGVTGTTLGATQEPSCSFAGNRSGVWYTIQVNQTSQIQIETCLPGTSFNTDLSVFTGGCGGLACFTGFSGDGYDGGSGCSTPSGAAGGPLSVFTAAPGVTYYIMVSGTFSTSVGNFALQANCTPILCDVPTLALTVQDAGGNNLSNAPCANFGNPFFVNAVLSGGNGNPTYSVTASGSGITSNTQVVNANGSFLFGPFNPGSVVSVNAVGVEQNLCSASGIATIAVCPPLNDLCANAFPAACAGTYEGSTLGSTNNPAQLYCGTSAPATTNGGVWYEFVLASDAAVDIDLSGSLYDTKVFLYSGSCGALTCVTGDDDGGDGVDSRIQTSLTAGTYYIYISGFSAARGQYLMNISCVNAACSPSVTATAVSNSQGTPLDGCVVVGELYFVQVALTGGAIGAIYDVSVNGSAPVQIAANSSGTVGPVIGGTAANVSVVSTTDVTCSGSASANPTVCPPTNDLCADAVALECGVTVFGTTINATQEVSCSFAGQRSGVWYSITVGQSSQIQLETCLPGTTFNTDISVFTGSCGALACFTGFSGDGYDGGSGVCAVFSGAAGGPNSVFTATPGVTYYIMVSGTFSTSVGNFALRANCTPILCTNPVVTSIIVDGGGNELTGCLAPGSSFFVKATVSGGAVNTTFNVTANNAGLQIASIGIPITFGPFVAGATININAVGIQNNLCSGTASVFGAFCSNNLACGPYSATPNAQIGPNSGAVTLSTIVITGTAGQVLTDLDVVVTGTHTFLADMDVFLISPGGVQIPLFQDQCGGGDNFDVRFDDGGATFACGVSGTNPILLGVFKPQGAALLSTFNGLPFEGTWTLSITDDAGGDQGNLSSWCLIPTLITPECDSPELSLTAVNAEGVAIDGDCINLGEQFSVLIALSGGDGNTSYAVVVNGGAVVSVAANSSITAGPFAPGANVGVTATGEQDAGCVVASSVSLGLCPPTNDLICSAQAVECGSTTPGSLVGATFDNVGTCTTSNTQPGVWYTITPGGSGTITAATCTLASFDTKISVFSAASCDGALVCIAGNDDGCGVQSTVSFPATGGTTYYILVHSFSTFVGTGAFSLALTCDLALESRLAGTASWNSNCGTRPAAVNLYTPNTNTIMGTYAVIMQVDGSFEVLGLTAGTYDVIVKVQGYLAKGAQDVVVGTGTTALPLGAIINGDVNNNNAINLPDVSLVNASFGSTTSSANYNPIADLNCSGSVNLSDISLLNAGFAQVGAVAPL